jgi:hypothetical protein
MTMETIAPLPAEQENEDDWMLPSQRRRLSPPASPAPAQPAPAATTLQSQTQESDENWMLPSQQRRAPNYQTMPWNEVLAKGASNFAPSAWNTAKEMATSLSPENLPDTLMGVGNLAAGAVSKGVGALGIRQDPKEKAQTEAVINGLMRHYGEKYGSREGVAKSIAENPASVLADFSSLLTMTPSSAARIPGVLGTAAKTARTVGELGTPIVGPAKVVGAAASAVSPTANAFLAPLAGVSFRSLQDAAKAGVASDPAFWEAASGKITAHDLISDVESALGKVAQDRSSAYAAGMSDLSKNATLPFGPIDQAVDRIDKMAFSGPLRIEKNKAAAAASQEIRDAVNEWKMGAQRDPYYQTIFGFDELKQRIRNIAQTYRGTPADRAVKEVADSVKNEIGKIDPKYANVMDRYSEMSDELGNLRRELTAGRGRTGTGLRKLLRAQNDKYKLELIDELAKRDPSLPAKISGVEIAHAHGHAAGVASFGALISHLLSDPHALVPTGIATAASIPQVAARTAAGVKQATAPFEFAGKTASAVSPLIGAIHARDEARKGREGRAAGGRTVQKAQTAQSLLAAVKRARKAIQSQTETILAKPDEHVVRALSLANKHV